MYKLISDLQSDVSPRLLPVGACAEDRSAVDPVGAENHVRAGHAACWYSWGMPPRRSCLRTSRWAS